MDELRVMTVKFGNKDLEKATKDIYAIAESARKSSFDVARIIGIVSKKECYKEDGFKSVHEWTEKAFGLKKTQSYALLKIANNYLVDVINKKNGKVIGSRSILVKEGDMDFTLTQIQKMFPLEIEDAKFLVEKGAISPIMSCKDIEDYVKTYYQPAVEERESTVDEVEESKNVSRETSTEPETELEESQKTEEYPKPAEPTYNQDTTVTVWDEVGNVYKVPYDLLQQFFYKNVTRVSETE